MTENPPTCCSCFTSLLWSVISCWVSGSLTGYTSYPDALTLVGLLECCRPVHISVCTSLRLHGENTIVHMAKPAVCAPLGLPLIAVGELHVHAVPAKEGPGVHRRVDVGWVRDGLTHQDSAGERRLPEAAQPPRWAAVVHLQLSSAVQHLPIGDTERPNVTRSASKTQIMNSLETYHPHNTVVKKQTHTRGLSWCWKIPKFSIQQLWPSSWLTWGWLCAPWWSPCTSSSWRSLFRCSALCLSCQRHYLEYIWWDTVKWSWFFFIFDDGEGLECLSADQLSSGWDFLWSPRGHMDGWSQRCCGQWGPPGRTQ